MTPRSRGAALGAALGLGAALSPGVADAQQTQPEGHAVTIDVRAESAVITRSSAGAGFLERLGIGFALGGKTAFIGGAYVGTIVGPDTPSFVLISPYVGVRLLIEPRYALDVTASYQQFIALDDSLEPTTGGFVSRESYGYGATVGAAFSLRLSEVFWASLFVDLGAASFDRDTIYVSPPASPRVTRASCSPSAGSRSTCAFPCELRGSLEHGARRWTWVGVQKWKRS